MTAAVLNTPVADLGENAKVLTLGTMPPQLMEGLAINGVQPKEISMDPPTAAPDVAPPAPKEDFMASFKSPTPGGMG